MKIAICSGYFDPIHIGHIEYIKRSKALADFLIVIVNNDHQAFLKKNLSFQSEDERVQIVGSIECVDEVVLSVDEDRTVCKTIEGIFNRYKEGNSFIFTNGGDQTKEVIPEKEICNKLGIGVVDKIVGQLNSSSKILEKYKDKVKK